MQSLIQQSLSLENNHDTYEALKIYQKTFGMDDFITEHLSIFYEKGPQVSLICLNCNDNFIDKFVYLLDTVKFSVAQDQDYLNRICKGRVKILDESWNKMPLESLADKEYDESKIKLIHYNLAYKPWHFEDIKYKDYFWNYAKKTEFLDEILRVKSLFTDEDRKQDRIKTENLIKLAKFEADCVGDDRG